MTLKNKVLSLLILMPLITHAAPYIYVANNDGNAVNVIDAATNSLVTTIALPQFSSTFPQPTCIAIAPNGKTVSVAQSNYGSSTFRISVSVIDSTLPIPALISTTEVTMTSLLTTYPFNIAYTPDSNSIYITDTGGLNKPVDLGAIYLINGIGTSSPTLSPTPITSINFPSAIAIGNTPNGTFAYIGVFYPNPIALNVYALDITSNVLTPIAGMATIYSKIEGIALSPDGLTAYAIAIDNQSSAQGRLYIIDTASNSLTNTIDLGGYSVPIGIVASPDGKYVYIADSFENQIIVVPTDNPSNVSTFPSTDPIALTISADSNTLYVINGGATVTSYRVPAGVQENSIALGGSVRQSSIVVSQLVALPPASVSGCKTKNAFLLQTDYINNLTWTAPASGSPVAYAIYRDSALTQLAGIVPASGPLQYYDHDRNPNITYTYYIVSVDSSGNQSAPAVVSVTQHC